ncbi:CvpA family protein [Marinobacterium aestuariivivens]|uniref:CvpA family protein n=1 Tax=Marinobacterium aestuariivivens TaxID=1698799 RepID=A0ABW2A7G0_9GAMM
MNWADWTIIAIVAVSGLFSLKRGFVREALSLATWVAAFVVARLFTAPLSLVLQDYIQTPSARIAVAFAILFLATLIVGAMISALIAALVQATGLSSTDRILGVGFGIARGALLIVVLVALLGITPAVQDPWWHESRLIPHFIQMESWTRDLAQDAVRAIWNVGR